jgi:MFS family permease
VNPSSGYPTTIAALSVGQIVSWAALYYGFSSFVLPMRREFGWSEPQIMGAFTLGLALWGAAAYAVGAAIDRGRGRAVLTLGPLLGGAGFLLWSRAGSLATLYAAWSLMGVAMAMLLYEPAFMVLTKRHPERYRQGITALTLVGGFASTLSFPAVAWLLAALDWRGAMAAIGVALLALAPLHAWALRGEPPGDGAGAPPPAAHGGERPDGPVDPTLPQALRTRAFWLFALCFTLHAFVVAAMWAHLMAALADKGLGPAQSLAVVVWFGPAQVAGRFAYLLFGRLLAPRALGLAVLASLPLAVAILALAGRTGALLVFAVLFGLANGLVTILRGGLLPDYFGRAHIGRISGAMTAIALLARAGAPLATAALLLALGGYRPMLLVLASLSAAALVAFALAGAPRRVGP